MKHKIVFFDMDGTLYQTENDIIQESALDAIQTLKDKGYICLCGNWPSLKSNETYITTRSI